METKDTPSENTEGISANSDSLLPRFNFDKSEIHEKTTGPTSETPDQDQTDCATPQTGYEFETSHKAIEIFLGTLKLFSECKDSIPEIAHQFQALVVPKNSFLVRKGENGDKMFILWKGKIKIPITEKNGTHRSDSFVHPQEVVGEMAVLTGKPRLEDAIVVKQDAIVLAIDRAQLDKLCMRYPSVARFLTLVVAGRLAERQYELGSYQIIKEHRTGGMGVVFKGLQNNLNRVVAIKMLPYALNQGLISRLQKEAKIIASLKHPNIVRVYDIAFDLGTVFMIMEFIQGTPLNELLHQRKRLASEETRDILIQLASALGYSHEKGIIHRDVKPANVIIEPSGTAQLMDFGVAVTTDDQLDESSLMGTPGYLAPEEIAHGTIDPRIDIYALGVVGYKMLTGRFPFTGFTNEEIIRSNRYDRVPAPKKLEKELNISIPNDLNEFVLKATSPDPRDRFQNMGEVATFLKGIIPDRRVRFIVTNILYDATHRTIVNNQLQHLKAEIEEEHGITVQMSESELVMKV